MHTSDISFKRHRFPPQIVSHGLCCIDRIPVDATKPLKAFRQKPSPDLIAAFHKRIERIFSIRTGYVDLDKLLARLHRRKSGLLRLLARPEIPLHTNASENDIRACVVGFHAELSRLRAHSFRAQQTEAAIGVAILDRMLACGRPQSVRRQALTGETK